MLKKASFASGEGFFAERGTLVPSDALGVLFGHGTEFVVPLLPEAAHKGGFEEAIDGQMQTASLLHSVAAYVAAVLVEGCRAVGEPLLADGVEGA